MRISGGGARGIPLQVPKGDAVRPATDGMRQAVFSSIAARLAGAHFWDLFAGSGAYGLEALSRGAAGGAFVEQNAKAVACLRKNLEAVGKSLQQDTSASRVWQTDALKFVAAPPAGLPPADLVFIDPPYELIENVAPDLFAGLSTALAAQPDPVVVFEMPGEMTLTAPGWTAVHRLGKGTRQPTVVFYKKSPST
jgi:16S rRNA (guanine966-N2)-methyltransferase